jgi:hypothetical protein
VQEIDLTESFGAFVEDPVHERPRVAVRAFIVIRELLA